MMKCIRTVNKKTLSIKISASELEGIILKHLGQEHDLKLWTKTNIETLNGDFLPGIDVTFEITDIQEVNL